MVNGKTIGDKKVEPGSKQHTYFGQFGIVHEKFKIKIMVTTEMITVSEHDKQEHLSWSQTSYVKGIKWVKYPQIQESISSIPVLHYQKKWLWCLKPS